MDENLTEQEEDELEEKQSSYAFADYSGVVVMIQTYYYRMLEMFRQYYVMVMKGRDDKNARQQIQSYVISLVQLLKRYSSVQSNEDAITVMKDIDDFISTAETMNYVKLKECVDVISDAHNILGLNKIEVLKKNAKRSLSGG